LLRESWIAEEQPVVRKRRSGGGRRSLRDRILFGSAPRGCRCARPRLQAEMLSASGGGGGGLSNLEERERGTSNSKRTQCGRFGKNVPATFCEEVWRIRCVRAGQGRPLRAVRDA